jgi:uncharacterized protein (DUF1499 family)
VTDEYNPHVLTLPLVSLAGAGLALLLVGLAGPAYRLGVPLGTAFTMLRWGAYLGLAVAVLAAASAYLAYRRQQRTQMAMAATALLLALIVVGVPYSWQRRAAAAPPIHDISTDLENPPAFAAIVPLRADAPNTLERSLEVSAQQRRAYPDLGPVTLSAPPDQAFAAALAVAQGRGWDIVTADSSAGRIEATDTTRWFGFKDDIVVRLTMWGAGTRVDVRSVSRVGRGDAGTNAQRIQQFLDDLSRTSPNR